MRTLQRSWIPGEHRSVPGLPEVPTDRIPDLIPNFDLVRALGLPLHVTLHFNDVLVLIAAVAVTLGTTWFLKRTRIGYAIRACAQDAEVAQMCGVNLNGTIRRAFAFGGALAGPEIANVAVDQFDVGSDVADIFNSAGREVIEDPDLLAHFEKAMGDIGADKTCSTGNQISHVST